MKLGLSIGYSGAELTLPVEKVLLAERIGFDSVWTAEAYGSDAISPLAYLAAVTKRIRLGTGIMQLAARPPVSAAMAAGTLDALAGGGRVIAGLGVSGPQIVEGWYGQPWGRPYWRIRDYVTIMRKVFERKEPVAHAGREISLPYIGPGALGVGKPLVSILHMNPGLPIWLGTGTEAMVKLTAEIADGWLPLGFVPRLMPMLRPWLEEGFRRAGGGKGFGDFEIQPRAEVTITDDVRGALARMKPRVALVEDLVCEHSLMYSRGSLGMLDYSDEERAMFRPVRQRLVRTHPVSGRKSLYLSSHAGAIVGMPTPEARILLRDLNEHATRPEFVYVHTWRPWDLVMWDNRQMMHRVRRYDESQPRDMRRTTVAGDIPTAAQVT